MAGKCTNAQSLIASGLTLVAGTCLIAIIYCYRIKPLFPEITKYIGGIFELLLVLSFILGIVLTTVGLYSKFFRC